MGTTRLSHANSRPPIRRYDADKSRGKKALLTTKKKIGVGTWNVRTLHQQGSLEILLNQMKKFDWEVLGISETHWTDSGEFIYQGYKILCSSNKSVHRQGVALILNKTAQSALLGYNPVSQRIMSARFQMKAGAITIIQVYAPNTADPEGEVDEFYDQLQTVVNKTNKNDLLIVMGDLNAKVGSDRTNWENVLGNYGYGSQNGRGEKLLNFCAANNLSVTNTMFKQRKQNRQWTWESPDQKTHNMIDYILINEKYKHCVTNARSFPSADVGSDHQLVLANLRLKFKINKKINYPKHYDVFRLKDPQVRANYEVEIGGRFAPLLDMPDTDTQTVWEEVKTAFAETSEKILGNRKAKKSKPWINCLSNPCGGGWCEETMTGYRCHYSVETGVTVDLQDLQRR
ncbi:craniofacial development protein 2-like [Diadema antillarum]|uniref:craniofacial development protein 2-like n=1 Tax=Diadema antillarum TaxID=105358 RepID=UPI003A8BE7A3